MTSIVGNFILHRQEWLEFSRTDGFTALDFSYLLDCEQLVRAWTHTFGNCLDILFANVFSVLDVQVVPLICSKDHFDILSNNWIFLPILDGLNSFKFILNSILTGLGLGVILPIQHGVKCIVKNVQLKHLMLLSFPHVTVDSSLSEFVLVIDIDYGSMLHVDVPKKKSACLILSGRGATQ